MNKSQFCILATQRRRKTLGCFGKDLRKLPRQHFVSKEDFSSVYFLYCHRQRFRICVEPKLRRFALVKNIQTFSKNRKKTCLFSCCPKTAVRTWDQRDAIHLHTYNGNVCPVEHLQDLHDKHTDSILRETKPDQKSAGPLLVRRDPTRSGGDNWHVPCAHQSSDLLDWCSARRTKKHRTTR